MCKKKVISFFKLNIYFFIFKMPLQPTKYASLLCADIKINFIGSEMQVALSEKGVELFTNRSVGVGAFIGLSMI